VRGTCLGTAVVLVLVLAAFCASAAAVTPVPYKRCQDVIIRNYDGSVYTRTRGLFAKRTSCRIARKVAHWFLVNDGSVTPHPQGFTCIGGSDGVSCRKGGRRVSWGYYRDRPAPNELDLALSA
jgi:hypothetical protein